MNLKKLILLSASLLLLASCSEEEEHFQYQAINDQQSIMQKIYLEHTENQSYLTQYLLKASETYDPSYDAFGELVPTACPIGSHYESTLESDISIYSGYLISKTKTSLYIGNKENIGSIKNNEINAGYWFLDFTDKSDEHKNKQELIERTEIKDNDLDWQIEDEKTGTAVEKSKVSHYFSNNINTIYESLFIKKLKQPTLTTQRQVNAYYKSESEIVETYNEVDTSILIQNPLNPGDENLLAVTKYTVGETTFKRISGIGWVGTDFHETTTYALTSDFNLNVLEEPRVIKTLDTTITFMYAANVQPYSGDPFIYQGKDSKIESNKPTLYQFDGENYNAIGVGQNITFEYKKLHGNFSGYAYLFESTLLKKDKYYSFACKKDVEGEEVHHESIGAKQIANNANGTLVDAKVDKHNLFKTIGDDAVYEFIVLIPNTGNKSITAHLSV